MSVIDGGLAHFVTEIPGQFASRPLDYLANIDRAIPHDSELRLRLGTEMPLAIDYDIADETGTVEYVLAPRMSAY